MLFEKTNLSFATLKNMTCKGYEPFLIDSLLPTKNLLRQYACQFSTLCSPTKRLARFDSTQIIPWFPKKGLMTYRGCVKCLAQDTMPYLRLYWQLPWIASCPLHQEYLQLFFPKDTAYISIAPELAAAPPAEVCFLDALTYQGLTTGIINLPNGEKTTISVWLRKLRSLLDELMCPASTLGSSYWIISYLQQRIELPFTKLHYMKRLFEELSVTEQIVILHAAGVVVKNLLSGNLLIKRPKNVWHLDREFLCNPIDPQDLPSYYNLLPKQRPDILKYDAILQELLQKDDGKLWEMARDNQLLAFTIRQQLVQHKKAKSSIQQIDADLKALGIPIIKQCN